VENKGWIALDIDGTITLDKYSVPKEVSHFFHALYKKGWQFVFATGRPFAFATVALSDFDFPYILLPQNGSMAIEMPKKNTLFKSYIPSSSLALMESAFEGLQSDFLIYAGFERGDICFWRPKRFPEEELAYVLDLQTRQKESWQEVKDFDHLPMDSFPLIKCFGSEMRMCHLIDRLKKEKKFEIAKIRDPFNEKITLLLITDIHASKGKSLTKLFKQRGRGPRVIAAGDDENDLSLLSVADIKIAMAHAPLSLQESADFIAPPTKEFGIIKALEIATRGRY
jgi:hydroxymethylpyrimidine pyrophosphatase-like HAD family hydrolase